MDITQASAEQLIAKYLAGQLPATESDAFEQYVCEHPEIRNEIEQTFKLKEGLARLRERGELAALLHEPARPRWLPYAAAAALAFATLGSVLWLQQGSPTPVALLLSPSDLASHYPGPPPIVGSYVLARMRGTTGTTDVRLPSGGGMIELKILPSEASPQAGYRVSLTRLDKSGERAGAAQINAVSAAPDGYVTVYVDAARLAQGSYEVSLTPVSPRDSTGNADRFVIRVQ